MLLYMSGELFHFQTLADVDPSHPKREDGGRANVLECLLKCYLIRTSESHVSVRSGTICMLRSSISVRSKALGSRTQVRMASKSLRKLSVEPLLAGHVALVEVEHVALL